MFNINNIINSRRWQAGLKIKNCKLKIALTIFTFFLFAFSFANAQTVDLQTGLIAHYNFDETSGTTANDSSLDGSRTLNMVLC